MERQGLQHPEDNFLVWNQLEEQFECELTPEEEKLLTEVDHLNANRLPDGSPHSQWTVDEQFKNLLSAVKEAAMPYAVSKTEHPYQEDAERDEQGRSVGAYMWLGKTAVENAMSGTRFHEHPVALKRVKVEVDEARDSVNLRPGVTKVFISPRMTHVDATYEEAKTEHLADDDAVRIAYGHFDEEGNPQKRTVESLLFRDIPLEAWVNFLRDPNNIFNKAVHVENNGSALPVMEAHPELEIENDKLPNGVISVVEAVLPYIKDPELRASAQVQLQRFYESQEDMHAKAVSIAKRWQNFEVDLADSMHRKEATPTIRAFINSMQTRWGDEDLRIILAHQKPNAQYSMSRKLAAILERAKQNLLWTRAGIVTGNEKVLEQVDETTAKRLYRDEMTIQIAADSGMYSNVLSLEAETDRKIAAQNFEVGGGCAGDSKGDFNGDESGERQYGSESGTSSSENKIGKITKGRCIIESCPTRPNEVLVGGCGVCLGRCQKLFDRGKDPSKMKTTSREVGKAATASLKKASPSTKPEELKPETKEPKLREFAPIA